MILYHTSAELQHFSSLGHVVEGILLGAAALTALTQEFGRLCTGRGRYLLPVLLLAAGLFLHGMILVHPTLAIMWAHARITLADLKQKQHFAMASLLFGSGVAETFATTHTRRPIACRPPSVAQARVLFVRSRAIS